MSENRVEQALVFNQSTGPFFTALHQPLNSMLTEFLEKNEATQGADSLFAQLAAVVSPQEVDLDQFRARNPYDNPAQQKQLMQGAAERGWITLSETGFSATPKSIDFTDRLVKKLEAYTTERQADFEFNFTRVVELLARVVKTAEQVPSFASKPSFTFARNFEYQDLTPSLLWVRRHLITLGAYRDDCHIASWKDLGLPGHVWESLTFIWQDQAHTPAELAEQLTFRGFNETDYAQAFDQLAGLGWVKIEEGKASLTEKGRQQRQHAEENTNQYYQAAFDGLSSNELEELISLIEQLTGALTPEEETV